MQRGRVSAIDKEGNDGADRLAVNAASLHAVPTHVVSEIQRKIAQARATHEMILSILEARQAAPTTAGPTSAAEMEIEEIEESDNMFASWGPK